MGAPHIMRDTKFAILGGGDFITDISQQEHHVYNVGPCSEDAVNKKFVASSALLGGGNYLYCSDSPDWKICADNNYSWTVDLWLKSAGAPAEANGLIIACQNNWKLELLETTKRLRFTQDGYTTLSTGDNAINDTDWHHIALIKVGSGPDCRWGIYVDGVNKAYYAANSTVVNTAGKLQMYPGPGVWAYRVNDVRITKNNVFGAWPSGDPWDLFIPPDEDFIKWHKHSSMVITAH